MMNIQFKSYFIPLLFISIFSIQNASAQEDFYTVINPGFEVNLGLNSEHWEQSFELEHEDIIYQNGEYDFRKLFLEVAESTSYHFNNQSIGLGLTYRFKEMYHSAIHDEFRISQTYTIDFPLSNGWAIGQELTVEERFQENFTVRARYLTVLTKDLSATTTVGVNGEFLYEIGKPQKPEYEYRVAAFVDFLIATDFSANFGLQYRYGDFVTNATKELYIITGFSLDL